MPDVMTSEQRSGCMASIRSKNTRPELIVRSLVHRMGYRFRLHRRELPGKPDLVFVSSRSVIFVHGCFWHQHAGCRFASKPATRAEFWSGKFEANVSRDGRVRRKLIEMGWRVLVIWECETRDLVELQKRIRQFLEAE
jgi:DNA mismatch endonuclease (patch repair protein)